MGGNDDQVVVKHYAKTDKEFDECLKIRVAVFVDEQGFTMEQELDEYDDDGIHLLATHQETGKPIGTARYVIVKSKVTRMAVLKNGRGLGVGKALLQAIEPIALSHGATQVIANSQMHARPFYQSLGYHEEGEVFDEDGAPHKKMVKSIGTA